MLRLYLNRILVTLLVFSAWIFLSDWVSGAPSSIIAYYTANYSDTTHGVILKSRVIELNRGAAYEIEYEYIVDSQKYISNKINLSANYRDIAYDTVQKYPPGKSVQVFFDSSNPNRAILVKTRPDAWLWLQLFATVIMSIATIYSICSKD